jgi:hypothetical protein
LGWDGQFQGRHSQKGRGDCCELGEKRQICHCAGGAAVSYWPGNTSWHTADDNRIWGWCVVGGRCGPFGQCPWA